MRMIPMNQHRLIGLLACLVVLYVRQANFQCNAQGECDQSILGNEDDYADYVDDLESNDFEPKLQQLQLVLSSALQLRDERDLFIRNPWNLDRGNFMTRLDDEFLGYTERFNVLLDGAVGDGITNDTDAFLAAWEKACDARNGEVYAPSGYTFLVYPSTFSGPCRCNIRFVVEGTVVAPEEMSAWDGLNIRYWLLFTHLDYFTLQGNGMFDGRGSNWWVCKEDKTCERAPTTVTVLKSSHVTVRYVTFVDAPQVHINFQDITTGHVKGIKVQAPWWSPNTDGIHISGTTDFAVQNCYVATGDDCVSIVSGSHNIGVYDTYCGIGCHGISVGSLGYNGQHANVTQVQVKNCQLESTTNGLRIKTWQGGSGIASNFDFRNIKMSNVSNPIIIDQFYCPPSQTEEPCNNQSTAVHIDLVKFTNITGTSASATAVKLACSDSEPCTNIRLKDINLTRMDGTVARAECSNAVGVATGVQNPPSCLTVNASATSTPLQLCLHSLRLLRQLWDVAFPWA